MTAFECHHCGQVIFSTDFPAYEQYQAARALHGDACTEGGWLARVNPPAAPSASVPLVAVEPSSGVAGVWRFRLTFLGWWVGVPLAFWTFVGLLAWEAAR